MRFLVEDKRVIIYGFVIMPNHLHTVWQMQSGIKGTMFKEIFSSSHLKELKIA